MRKQYVLLLNVFLLTAHLGAAPLASALTEPLGWTVPESFEHLGAPESVFAFRGTVPGEDNVVFYYPDHLYLFFFQDRVWQVRTDSRREGETDGVRMGMSRAEITEIWGAPVNDTDPQPTWVLPDAGYPVRIRLYFDENDLLDDLYVYRADW